MTDHYAHPDPTVRELLAAAYEQGKKDAALEFINGLLYIGDAMDLDLQSAEVPQ